jgi:hypothetical protein
VESNVISRIAEERVKQKKWGSDEFDKGNSRNDWVAYITSYAGDAAEKVRKKTCSSQEEEDRRYVDNLIKVATLAIAAIEAHEKGYC